MPRVEIEFDLSALDSVHMAAMASAFEAMAALKGEIVTAQVVPFDTGKLQESMGAIDQFEEGDKIHTALCIGDTAYARRLYFHPEYNFQTVNNPNAQAEWAQPWLPGGDLEGFVPYAFESRMEEKLR